MNYLLPLLLTLVGCCEHRAAIPFKLEHVHVIGCRISVVGEFRYLTVIGPDDKLRSFWVRDQKECSVWNGATWWNFELIGEADSNAYKAVAVGVAR